MKKKKIRPSITTCIITAIVGILFVLFAVEIIKEDKEYRKTHVSTIGYAIDFVQDGDYYNPLIEYEVDGIKYTVEVYTHSEEMIADWNGYEILYDPKNPSEATIAQDYGSITILFFIATLFFIPSIMRTIKFIRYKLQHLDEDIVDTEPEEPLEEVEQKCNTNIVFGVILIVFAIFISAEDLITIFKDVFALQRYKLVTADVVSVSRGYADNWKIKIKYDFKKETYNTTITYNMTEEEADNLGDKVYVMVDTKNPTTALTNFEYHRSFSGILFGVIFFLIGFVMAIKAYIKLKIRRAKEKRRVV